MKKKICVLVIVLLTAQTFAQNFRTIWRTTAATEQITIPTTGGGYNYNVDWGDGTADNLAVVGDVSHTYAVAGDYTVTISGDFPRIYFNNVGDKTKIRSIEEWGSAISWTSMERAFSGCSNLINNALDEPDLSGVTTLAFMFWNCASIGTGSSVRWNNWDTSSIIKMNYMFHSAVLFNKDLNNWNVSNVDTMERMFFGATVFNGNIGSWNTDSLLNMNRMFANATAFNQELIYNAVTHQWDTSEVTNMGFLFYGTDFNGDISNWETGLVEIMSSLFSGNSSFNMDISGWDTSSATNMSFMFTGASSFNQDISGWSTSNVATFQNMFTNATAFNQDLSSWDVENVTNMTNVFNGVTLSTKNYDAILIAWDAQTLQNGVTFHGGNSKYYSPAAQAARANMIASDSWTFTADGGLLTELEWTGATDTDWNIASNWNEGIVPTSLQNVTVTNHPNNPTISAGVSAASNGFILDMNATLTINAGANLTISDSFNQQFDSETIIKSNATSSGSLIMGSYVPTGKSTYQRYVKGGEWHLISTPVFSSAISSFEADLMTSGTNISIATYDNSIVGPAIH